MNKDFTIEKLGSAKIHSPIHLGTEPGDLLADFTRDDARVVTELYPDVLKGYFERGEDPPTMELAGPREKIYFDASKLKVGIVTCGGICPGLNDVIRGLVMTLHYGYGVAGIIGFRYGFAGLNPEDGHSIIELTPKVVRDIHTRGGTVLGTSRGPQDPEVMVDTLERMNIGLFIAIGGDGTFRGALSIYEEIKKRNLKIGVIGVPKTIDNDIPLVDHTFGFETAVGLAAEAIQAAYAEASSVRRGVGLVKLMGRHAGFISANAALAVRNVNMVLIPEVPFDLEGEAGLYNYIEKRFKKEKSTVIVVAEGAGQRHLKQSNGSDASGNTTLGDFGVFLKQKINERFGGSYRFSLKYIDPSYIIRSQSACSNDSIFCGYLAQSAVHAGMSGRTGMAVGRSHRKFTHIPLSVLVSESKRVDPEGELWLSVLESTGQPFFMTAKPDKELSRMSFTPHW
ncbi:MAG: ATP-dependent 6-phosphofructokinase [Deltaproteobacteria bacterium]|nr:ATP-dependent 6-phosphofructokinase [Deltaproteobacteria bacterium]